MNRSPAALPRYAKQGYAAITSVIVVLLVIVVIGTATSLMAIGNMQMSLGQTKNEATIALVNSCIEDALLYYNNFNSIPSTRTTPLGSCSLVINSSTATTTTFTTTASLGGYYKSIQVAASRTGSVNVVGWMEVN